MVDKACTFTEQYSSVSFNLNADSWYVTTAGISGGANRVACILAAVTVDTIAFPPVIGVRAVGSSLDRKINLHEAEGGGSTSAIFHVQLDSNGKFETWVTPYGSSWTITCLGVYGSAISFTEKADTLSFTAATWQDVTLSDGASRVHELSCSNSNQGAATTIGVRTKGSSTNRYYAVHECESGAGSGDGNSYTSYTTADASKVIQAYRSTTDGVVKDLGYFSSNVALDETFTSIGTGGSDGVWQEYTAADGYDGAVALVACMHQDTTAETYVGVRSDNSSVERKFQEHEAESNGFTGDTMPVLVGQTTTQVFDWVCADVSEAGFYILGYLYETGAASCSINVYDEGHVAEDKTSKNENLGPVSVNTVISVDEFINSITSITDINVYDSVITDSVNQTVSVDKVTPSPNVFDSVSVEDELGTEADNENLGPVNVNTEVSIDEFIDILASIADINVSDYVTVAEESSEVFDLACNIYDEINTDESGTEVDNKDLAGINAYNEITVSDTVEGAVSLKDIDTYDSVTVTEDLGIAPDLAYSVYDEIAVTEDSPVYVSAVETVIEDFEIFLSTSVFTYDEISIGEDTVCNISVIDVETSIFDEVTVSESVVLGNEQGGINVSDLVGTAEYIVTSISDPAISVSDSISISESISFELPVSTLVFDLITVTESITSQLTDLAGISVYDTVTVSEDADVLVEVIGELYTSVYDSVSVTEFITAVVPTVSTSVNDSISVLEQVTLSVSGLVLSTSDTVTITESITNATSISGINVIDLVAVTDVDSVSIPFCQTNIFDSITTAEQVVSTVDIPGINVSDSTSIEDVATVIPEGAVVHLNISGIFELVTVSEVIFRSLSDLARQVYDSVSVSEYKNASINISGINVSDTVTVVDYTSAVVSVPSYIYISGIYETVTISEAVTTRLSDLPAITYDSVSISETIEVAPDVIVTAYETVTVNEQVLILNTVNVSIFDTSGISESVSVVLDYGVNVSDVVNVRELVSGVGGDLSRSVFDTVSVRDWGYIYWLLAAGRLEVNCEGLGISVDTLGFMDRIGVDGIEIDIEALGI